MTTVKTSDDIERDIDFQSDTIRHYELEFEKHEKRELKEDRRKLARRNVKKDIRHKEKQS